MAVIIESFATAHNGGSNQTTLTIGKPTGTVEGDLLVCFLFSRREGGTVNNHSTLSGWTLIQTAQSNPTSVLMVTSSFYKVATDSEPDDYTWTQSESQRFCGIIMRVTGLDTANPIDVFDAATYQETPGNNLIPAPSVTPTVTNGFLVCGVGFPWAGVTFTASPPGMTEVYNFNAEQNALNAAVAVQQLTTDDPTGRRDWTATDYWSIGQSVVFRQEAGGTPATVTPSAVAATIAVPAPSITVAPTASPPVIAATTAVPQPSITAGAVATPGVVAATVAVPQPSISTGVLVTPSAVVVATSVPQPGVDVPTVVSASVVSVVTAVPAAAAEVSATAKPMVIAVAVNLPAALARAGAAIVRAKDYGVFQRINTRLHIARIRRSLRRGFAPDEGWEVVSDIFLFDEDPTSTASLDQAMAAVAQVWADHQGSDAATLKAAINDALNAFGFRRPDGTTLGS